MRHFMLLAGFILSLNASGQGILPTSSAKMRDGSNTFDARVCLGDPMGLKSYANRGVAVGRMHAMPSSNEDRSYVFETDERASHQKPPTSDDEGCLLITDKLSFSEPESDPANRAGQFDPIAERIYGLRFGNSTNLVIVHVQFNRGIKTGRILIDVRR